VPQGIIPLHKSCKFPPPPGSLDEESLVGGIMGRGSLRTLHLESTFSEHFSLVQLENIRDSCSNLTEIEVSIPIDIEKMSLSQSSPNRLIWSTAWSYPEPHGLWLTLGRYSQLHFLTGNDAMQSALTISWQIEEYMKLLTSFENLKVLHVFIIPEQYALATEEEARTSAGNNKNNTHFVIYKARNILQ
jgi:hypothetical protein